MPLDKVWVLVDRSEDKPKPVSLELLSKAHEIGGTVEGVTWGDGAPLAAEVGAHGAAILHTIGDLGQGLPGPALGAAMAAQVAAGNSPDAILVPQTYDGRDTAGRLSARIDRPVLTNIVGAEAGDGQLVTEHAIFGGTEILKARFTGATPGIFVIRAKSFAAEPTGGSAAAVDEWEVPALGAEGAARVLSSHVEESEGPKLDEAAIVVSGGRGLGQAAGYQMIEDLAKLLGGAAGASRHRRRRLGSLLAPGRSDREDGQTDHLHRRRYFRSHPAHGWDEERQEHHRRQQGPGGADLFDRRSGNRRRRQQSAAQADRGAPPAGLSDRRLDHPALILERNRT